MKTELLWQGPGPVREPRALGATAASVVGGLLLVWSGYIHFHLWQDGGYKHIPTISTLFLLQAIAGLVLGLLVIGVRRVWASLLGIGFALSTMVGFVFDVALPHGLFNFKDSWAAPFAEQAFGIEIAAIVVLLVGTALCLVASPAGHRTSITPA
jgi:hypothetical protein